MTMRMRTGDPADLPGTVSPAALGRFRDRMVGEVVDPGDDSYDLARRVWNGSTDRRPALIARCSGVADVVAAVRFGRETGMEIAVRSGGHSFPGLSVVDGGWLSISGR